MMLSKIHDAIETMGFLIRKKSIRLAAASCKITMKSGLSKIIHFKNERFLGYKASFFTYRSFRSLFNDGFRILNYRFPLKDWEAAAAAFGRGSFILFRLVRGQYLWLG